MSKLHGKSVLLGMGIGIIFTALLGLIFFLGYMPEGDEVKIKKLARKYGMVDASELQTKISLEVAKDDTLAMITDKLAEAGLIRQDNDNKVAFQIKLANKKAQGEISPGTYEFFGGESEDEIIGILTSGNGNK